jgi:hypothetical protein
VIPLFLLGRIIGDKGCDSYLPQHGGDVSEVIGWAEGRGAASIHLGLTPVFSALIKAYGGIK